MVPYSEFLSLSLFFLPFLFLSGINTNPAGFTRSELTTGTWFSLSEIAGSQQGHLSCLLVVAAGIAADEFLKGLCSFVPSELSPVRKT